MTAVYAAKIGSTVQVMADAATCRRDGTLFDIKQKIQLSEDGRVAFVGRGSSILLALIGVMVTELAANRSFDELIAEIERGLTINRAKFDAYSSELEILVAGFDNGPRLAALVTHRHYDGVEPWKFHERDEVGMGPVPSLDQMTAAGITASSVMEAGEYALVTYGAAIMEMVRRVPGEHYQDDLGDRYWVGGHADLVVLHPEGAFHQRLVEWPEDVIGQKITPYACAA